MERERGNRFALWLVIAGLTIVAASPFFIRRAPVVTPAPASASMNRGRSVPAYELRDLDGKDIRPQDFSGKVVLINFWGTTCAPCMEEIPWLVDFQKRYGPKGLAVLAISMYGDGPDVLKPYVAEHKMQNFTVVIGSEKISELFGGIYGFPHTFIVDRQGNFVSSHAGIIDRDRMETELARLLDQASTKS